jgi:hypothetical protein
MVIEILTAASDAAFASPGATLEGDALWVPADELPGATGWELKPEGMCLDEVCIPLYGPTAEALVREHDGATWVDFAGFARYVNLPSARTGSGDAWYFSGDAAQASAGSGLAGMLAPPPGPLLAPDFELPDLEGRMHRRSDHRGKKVLLAVWASW